MKSQYVMDGKVNYGIQRAVIDKESRQVLELYRKEASYRSLLMLHASYRQIFFIYRLSKLLFPMIKVRVSVAHTC